MAHAKRPAQVQFLTGQLCFGDFTGLDAVGADADPLVTAPDLRLHRVQVDVPASARHIVRVGHIVAKLRPFAANITYLCHDVVLVFLPFQWVEMAAGMALCWPGPQYVPDRRAPASNFWPEHFVFSLMDAPCENQFHRFAYNESWAAPAP